MLYCAVDGMMWSGSVLLGECYVLLLVKTEELRAIQSTVISQSDVVLVNVRLFTPTITGTRIIKQVTIVKQIIKMHSQTTAMCNP